MIKIDHLFKSYGKIVALRDVCLQFERGQCVALIGPNGSGKTTLMKSILQILRPDAGAILINDMVVKGGNQYRREIGYLPQISRFPEHMRVGSLFSLMSRIRNGKHPLDRELYEQLSIDTYANRQLGTLSEGMRQKVNAALTFYFNPQILILDEPTASLDPVSGMALRSKIGKSLKENKLVLISSHIMSDLDELATHVVYLMSGRVLLNSELNALRAETGEKQLNRIIPHLLEKEDISYG